MSLEIVEAFARALDADDFELAATLLDPRCEYRIGDRVLVGVAAIIAAYRENGEKARRTFDEVGYASSVSVEDHRYLVQFTDRLRAGSFRHEFRCQQLVTVDGAGRIAHIEHRELDGEREQLQAFFRRAGVTW